MSLNLYPLLGKFDELPAVAPEGRMQTHKRIRQNKYFLLFLFPKSSFCCVVTLAVRRRRANDDSAISTDKPIHFVSRFMSIGSFWQRLNRGKASTQRWTCAVTIATRLWRPFRLSPPPRLDPPWRTSPPPSTNSDLGARKTRTCAHAQTPTRHSRETLHLQGRLTLCSCKEAPVWTELL